MVQALFHMGWSENESNESSFAETSAKLNFKLVLKGRDLTEVSTCITLYTLSSHTLIFTQHTSIHVLILIIRFRLAFFLIQVAIRTDGILISIVQMRAVSLAQMIAVSLVQMRAVSLVQMRAWIAVLIQIPWKIRMNEI